MNDSKKLKTNLMKKIRDKIEGKIVNFFKKQFKVVGYKMSKLVLDERITF